MYICGRTIAPEYVVKVVEIVNVRRGKVVGTVNKPSSVIVLSNTIPTGITAN